MIDSSRSPRPLWNRILTGVLLAVAIVLAVWIVWVKELHHKDIHVHALTPPTAVGISLSAPRNI
jgi:hypothetical protein